MKICLCVGARPNFIKAAQLIREIKKHSDIEYRLIHTGQHYDKNMSDCFFDELEIPEPDINLNAYNADDCSALAIGRTITFLTDQMKINLPDMMIVFGDVDSTLACAIVANKMKIPLAHIEAGERCRDRSMPEEMNRILVDNMANYCFCASKVGFEHLLYEGLSRKALISGDLMVDQLIYSLPKIENYAVRNEDYGILTLHRQENVDNIERLRKIINAIENIDMPILLYFPVHPRTAKTLFDIGHGKQYKNIRLMDPQSYLDFLALVSNAKFVITDSGGLQTETSYLNVPCITLRKRIEWKLTLTKGSNELISPDNLDGDILDRMIDKIISGEWKQSKFKDNPIHDGKAAERIVKIIKENA